MSMQIVDDSTVVKSSKIYFSGPRPYRYVLRYVPKQDPAHPYHANRENMRLVGDIWEPESKYWTSCRDSLEEAEKEYQKKLDTEPKY